MYSTYSAVLTFQEKAGLNVDGIVDSNTLSKLVLAFHYVERLNLDSCKYQWYSTFMNLPYPEPPQYYVEFSQPLYGIRREIWPEFIKGEDIELAASRYTDVLIAAYAPGLMTSAANGMWAVSGYVTNGIGNTMREVAKSINASELKMSKTVQNHSNDIIKKGTNKGDFVRPYINSNGTTLLIDEIMKGGTPVKDSILKNGLRWDVEGTFRGSTGTWELVVDTSSNTIVHFNFVAK